MQLGYGTPPATGSTQKKTTGARLDEKTITTLKEFKALIRKLKIDSFLEKDNNLSNLKLDLNRNEKTYNSIAKDLSKYGCLTGSYYYSTLGLIEKNHFKDFDLIVTTKSFEKIKKEFSVATEYSYVGIDVNGVGVFNYRGHIVDLFIDDNTDYITEKDINFQKNLLHCLISKVEIFENSIKERSTTRYYINTDVENIIDVLRGNVEPFEKPKDTRSLGDKILDFFFD